MAESEQSFFQNRRVWLIGGAVLAALLVFRNGAGGKRQRRGKAGPIFCGLPARTPNKASTTGPWISWIGFLLKNPDDQEATTLRNQVVAAKRANSQNQNSQLQSLAEQNQALQSSLQSLANGSKVGPGNTTSTALLEAQKAESEARAREAAAREKEAEARRQEAVNCSWPNSWKPQTGRRGAAKSRRRQAAGRRAGPFGQVIGRGGRPAT